MGSILLIFVAVEETVASSIELVRRYRLPLEIGIGHSLDDSESKSDEE